MQPISSLVAGLHLFDVQGILFTYLRLEAFEVAEVLLRQLLFRCRAPIPDDDERTRIHTMRLPAEGLHPRFTKATLILAVAHRLMIGERSGRVASICRLFCESNIPRPRKPREQLHGIHLQCLRHRSELAPLPAPLVGFDPTHETKRTLKAVANLPTSC